MSAQRDCRMNEDKTKAQDENTESSMPARPRYNLLTGSARMKENEDLLYRTVSDAGLNTFGCIFLEVWVLNKDGTKLRRAPGGAWMDSAFRGSLCSDDMMEADNLQAEAQDVAPGAGLAGTLFAETSEGKVHWRQIRSMINDPFIQQCSSGRMKKIYLLGIGSVGASSFSYGVDRGVVLYYSRTTANNESLRSSTNEQYMMDYADFIGASLKFIKNRGECADMRRKMLVNAIEKVRADVAKRQARRALGSLDLLSSAVLDKEKMSQLRDMMSMQDLEAEQQQTPKHTLCETAERFKNKIVHICYTAARRVKKSPKKWKGAHMHGPDRHSLSDAAVVFVWVFVVMLVILKLSTALAGGQVFAFDGAWYSGTLCILFALTPAPVGQPRQIILAHLFNMILGIALRQIPTAEMAWGESNSEVRSGMPLIYKQALAVAFGISGQAVFGIIHPPATGLSLSFASSNKWSWDTMAAVLLIDAVVIALSVLLINLSERGQYPLWWLGFGWENSGGSLPHAIKAAKRKTSLMSSTTSNDVEDTFGDNTV